MTFHRNSIDLGLSNSCLPRFLYQALGFWEEFCKENHQGKKSENEMDTKQVCQCFISPRTALKSEEDELRHR